MDDIKRSPDEGQHIENLIDHEAPRVDDTPLPALLEFVLSREQSLAQRIDGVLVGHILALETADAPRVTFPQGPPHGVPARAMLPLCPQDVGRAIALMFEGGDPCRPIVMGRMATPAQANPSPPIIAETDGRLVEITAEEQLVLRCGESSITLTRSGKVIIRGNYILSRSSGVNCIQGGSVEIN